MNEQKLKRESWDKQKLCILYSRSICLALRWKSSCLTRVLLIVLCIVCINISVQENGNTGTSLFIPVQFNSLLY